jgi:hypothetical protein
MLTKGTRLILMYVTPNIVINHIKRLLEVLAWLMEVFLAVSVSYFVAILIYLR